MPTVTLKATASHQLISPSSYAMRGNILWIVMRARLQSYEGPGSTQAPQYRMFSEDDVIKDVPEVSSPHLSRIPFSAVSEHRQYAGHCYESKSAPPVSATS